MGAPVELQFSRPFIIISCANCGMDFGITSRFDADRRIDHAQFYCPAGHINIYPSKTEMDRLREDKTLAWAQINEERHGRLVAEKKLAEEQQEAARLRNRILHGVCPCCNRTFQNIAEHMKSEHPAEIPGHERKEIAASEEISIDDLEVSVRAYNVIKNAAIRNVSDFARFSERDLLAWKNCGRHTLNEIKQQIALHGVGLRQ